MRGGDKWRGLRLTDAASLDTADVIGRLEVSEAGLTTEEAKRRLALAGANVIRSHGTRAPEILLRQIKNPLFVLLVGAAVTSFVVGERTDAVIILGIITFSVGLGFVNEYRAARTVEALHSRIRHTASAIRDGHAIKVDVTDLVPGDVVRLEVGDVVPADIRVLEAHEMECDEAVLTGEATAAEKNPDPATPGDSPLDLPSCVFMGTVVRNGVGRGVVVQTGRGTEFGKIATRLGEAQDQTAFQLGLQSFSFLLLQVTIVLTVSIFVVNTVLSRPLLDSALFSLAIAVGLTPQLLPAIVTVSLSLGSRRLAKKSVIVKRLVSIEDLGNVEVLFTDKTGTLTEGRITFSAALGVAGEPSPDILLLGLLCNSVIAEDGELVGGNPLDRALLEASGADPAAARQFTRLSEAPFDYERRLMSVLVEEGEAHHRIITKGAPESVLARCREVPGSAQAVLNQEFQAGSRIIAVATREAGDLSAVTAADERDLTLVGFLTFADRVKPDAGGAIQRLAKLGVTTKLVTGDNDQVAKKVCSDLKIRVGGTLTGAAVESMTDDQLAAAIAETTIFARVTPEQKSRIIRLQRKRGMDVGFLGDGVNDAVALHDADVGISVDSATDVAKDAADIVLLEKDLDILADGVVEGRRIFSNTIKYVLMGTSSNFGNMFSAAGGSLVLSFLPMLPTQILLNNFLYDVSEMTIPTDNVDEELLRRPAHWDMSFIRRFMLFFGPISSVYDFLTFAVMIGLFDAGETLFHTGWFVESLSTQTLVIFVIRTKRTPFFRSRPSLPLLATTLTCVIVGIVIPFSPLADPLGFDALPLDFFAILGVMVVTYLGLVEFGKSRFFRLQPGAEPLARRKPPQERRIHRRAARWSKSRATGDAGSKWSA
jgi:Mg2+-importing ATPase